MMVSSIQIAVESYHFPTCRNTPYNYGVSPKYWLQSRLSCVRLYQSVSCFWLKHWINQVLKCDPETSLLKLQTPTSATQSLQLLLNAMHGYTLDHETQPKEEQHGRRHNGILPLLHKWKRIYGGLVVDIPPLLPSPAITVHPEWKLTDSVANSRIRQDDYFPSKIPTCSKTAPLLDDYIDWSGKEIQLMITGVSLNVCWYTVT